MRAYVAVPGHCTIAQETKQRSMPISSCTDGFRDESVQTLRVGLLTTAQLAD